MPLRDDQSRETLTLPNSISILLIFTFKLSNGWFTAVYLETSIFLKRSSFTQKHLVFNSMILFWQDYIQYRQKSHLK